ncbi:MAG: Crp/Fnr family transcriptional regulator [Verrucomicrobiota bacterium]|nr:Crp/Fnr family transcriptional regulator [Verrucomicrobiota bacterium]
MFDLKVDFSKLDVVSFNDGENIIEEGKTSEKVYVLKEGEVTISVGENHVYTEKCEGTFFGEISKLLDRKQSATLTAKGKCELYLIKDLFKFTKEFPEVAFNMSKILAKRLIQTDEVLREVKKTTSELHDTTEKEKAKGKLSALVAKLDKLLDPLEREVMHPLTKTNKE